VEATSIAMYSLLEDVGKWRVNLLLWRTAWLPLYLALRLNRY